MSSSGARVDFVSLHTLVDAKPSEKCVLRLGNGAEYTVVQSALAKRSKYFQGMFREGSELKEASEAVVEIDLPYNNKFKDMWLYLMTGSHTTLKKPKDFIENAKNADYLGVEPRRLFLSIFRQNTAGVVKANIGRLEQLPKDCLKRLGLDYLESEGVKSPSRHAGGRAPRYSSDDDNSSTSESESSDDSDDFIIRGEE